MAVQFNIHDAKTHFSALLSRVLAGEEIIIAKAGHPIARLLPLAPSSAEVRVPGARTGGMWMSDDFDDSLPEDFLSTRAV